MSGGLQNYQPFHSALKLFSITIGTALQVPRVNAGGTAIEWATVAGVGGSVATDAIWDAAGDLVVGTGADTAARLAKGTALQTLRVNSGATALEWATNSISTIVGVSSTKAEFDTACSDGNFAYVGAENVFTVEQFFTGDATSNIAINVNAGSGDVVGWISFRNNAGTTERAAIGATASNLNYYAPVHRFYETDGFTFGDILVGTIGTVGAIAAGGAVTGSNLSGTNTGDNATNTQYSGLVSNATHTGDATGATALTVVAINGTLLSVLATGILKNTTTTGVPSIAVAGTDYVAPSGSYTALRTTEVTNTVSANAATITLGNGNHQTLTLAAATGAVTADFVMPSSSSAGTLVLLQDDTARDVTWTATGGGTILWAGTQPTWASDTASSYRVISWRYDGTRLFLAPTDAFTANS